MHTTPNSSSNPEDLFDKEIERLGRLSKQHNDISVKMERVVKFAICFVAFCLAVVINYLLNKHK